MYCSNALTSHQNLLRYTDAPLESVIEGVRAYDGKSYGDLVGVWRDCLKSPDVEDAGSAARRRLEELAASLREVYCLKVGCARLRHRLPIVTPLSRKPTG